jgi:crotonobetainyl-CoA:carnitine CoA-transferase CaiB-like acyl-CoA transferase
VSESNAERKLPLSDIRIVAIEQYGAGPFGSGHLADLGAEVIKIENPNQGGDVGRMVPPFQEGDDSLFFESVNRNKRSIDLDITNESGRKVFEDLVAVSDAVFSNLRGDVPDQLRLTFEHLSVVNPAIVCASLSGFGMTGPRSADPGYDYIIQAMTGWMALTGEPDGPPTKSGLSLVDWCGGYVAAISILAGIHAARRDGVGMDCDLSLYDTAVSLLTYQAAWYLTGGLEPERKSKSAHPSLVPFQAFEAADGWLTVACPKEKFWVKLASAIGRPELADDPRFSDFAARGANAGELSSILDEAFLSETVSTWVQRLTDAGVPNGPVREFEQVFADPHTEARQMIVETDHPRLGKVRQVGSSVRVGPVRTDHRPGPDRNEAFEYVTELLSYSEDTVVDLVSGGAFGRDPINTSRTHR